MQTAEKRQANFFISTRLLTDLKSSVPARKQSEFVEAAITKELKRKKFLHALERASGAWKGHPKNTESFIRSLRNSKRI